MKHSWRSASRRGSFACLLILHFCTATASRAAILAGPITNAANGHTYYLLSPTNWPSAEAEAVSLHGHLATINDVAENTWVFNRFATSGGVARSLWLGLNDAAQEGNWVWVGGEAAAYRNWAPGEPNNGGGFYLNEDQVVMRGPAQAYSDSWNDAPGEQIHAAVVEVAVSAPPTNTGTYDVASGFSTDRNPNGVWSYGSSATLGGPMTLLPDHGSWAGLDYWRAAILLGVPGVYHNPAHVSVTNGTGTAVLGPGQLSFYPGPNGEFCVIRFAAPAKGVYQVSGAFTGVDPHGTFTDVHILVNGVIFNGSVTGYGAGSGPTFNLIVNLNPGDPIDFVVGRSANTQFSFDSTGLSVQIIPPLVGIPPTITSQPQSRSVNAGTNVTFFVTAAGTGPLSYQWRRNGTNLAGANGPSLTLSNVQPANAGTYSVRVTNAFGAATSSNAVLTVLPLSTNCVAPPPGLVSWWRAENPGAGQATLLTFDELPATSSNDNWAPIPNGYGGMQWNNFGVLNGLSRPPTEGYRTGTVSPQNVAFNLFGDPASFSRPTPFTLKSAYVTAAFVNGLQVRVVGWLGTTLVHSNSYTLSTTAPTLLTFNYVGVDRVTFTPSVHSGFFALDNLIVDGANIALDSADANHGTPVGNVTSAAGRVGQAFVLDGNGDGVRIGNPTNLQLQNFTIEAWIKRTSSSVVSFSLGGLWAEFFCYGTGGYAFGLHNSGQLFLSKVDIDQTQTPVGIGITDTNFHHVAVTKSGSVVVFYIDGAAYPVTPYNTTYTFTSPTAIGVRGDNLSSSFYGAIDELAVYNRPLTSAEIQGIFTAGSAGKCASTAGIPPTITSQPQSRTVNAGTSVTFFVTATGTTPLSYQWRRNETNLPGATGPSLTLSNVQPANAGSYSVRVTNAFGAVTSSDAVLTVLPPSSPILAGPITNPANGHVYFLIASNTWTGAEAHAVTLGGHLVTINDANENAWVLSTFGSFGGVARPLWIGLNDAAVEGVFVWVSGEAATYRNWMPGEPNNGGEFVPDEDYVRMRGPGLSFSNAWNDTLNSGLYVGVVEISPLGPGVNCVIPSAGLVSWWRAEGNANDSVGTNNGTTPFEMGYAAGEVGLAFDFNGTSRRVSVPDSPVFRLTNSFAVEGWVFSRQSNNGVIFIRGDNRAGLDPMMLNMLGLPGYVRFQIQNAANQSASVQAPVQLNQWQHIAATLDGTNGSMTVYVNGVVRAQTNTTIRPLANLDPSQQPAIGIGNHGGTTHQFPFHGLIDEISLYSRALSQNEIQAIYHAGSNGKCINRTPIAGASGLTSLVCGPGAKAKLCFAGVAGNTYTIQASTNLIDWEVVGVSVADPNGVCEFEDSDSTRFSSRYYRVVLPRPARSSWKFDDKVQVE